MAPEDGYIAEFNSNINTLTVREVSWGTRGTASFAGSTRCASRDDADRAAKQLGFALFKPWEDCGNGRYVREAYRL